MDHGFYRWPRSSPSGASPSCQLNNLVGLNANAQLGAMEDRSSAAASQDT